VAKKCFVNVNQLQQSLFLKSTLANDKKKDDENRP
jgi:hypothetical protein